MDIATLSGDFYPTNSILYYESEEVVRNESPATSHTDEEGEEEVCLPLSSENPFEAGTRTVPEGNNGRVNSCSPSSIVSGCNTARFNEALQDASIFYAPEGYLNLELSTPGSSSASSHIDSMEIIGDSPQPAIYLKQAPEEQSQSGILFECDENFGIQQEKEESDDIMTPSKEQQQTSCSTIPLVNKDFKHLFNSDIKASNYFLNESFSYDIQERIIMEDSHRSSELSDPHIPIEKFSEKMQLELITDINKSSSEQDYTCIKNNGHEDNTKKVSKCNNKYNLSTSSFNIKSGDGASCNTVSNDFCCKRKVRFNLKCKQEKGAKRKAKPLCSSLRNSLLAKRFTNRFGSFKRKLKENTGCCSLNQKADNVCRSNYNVIETPINDAPKRTSCTLTKLQCPIENGSLENVPKVDDFFIDYGKFSFPYDNYSLPDDIFQPLENNQSFSEEFPNESLVEINGFTYTSEDLLKKDNNISKDIEKVMPPLKSEDMIIKDNNDFAKISESYESLSFEMEDGSEVGSSPMQDLSVSPAKSEKIQERNSEAISDELELDFEGFEYSAKNSVESSSLEHKRVTIMKAISAQENRQESSELSCSESDYSNEENVSPDSSVELRPDVQVSDVSTSGNIEDEREEKKILTKSKKENLSVGEERDKLHHLKGYQKQIRSSFPDDIIKRLKDSSGKKLSCTKILSQVFLSKEMRKKCMSQSKKKSKMKKKSFKEQVENWNMLLFCKGNNKDRTVQISSPDHNYCKTPEKKNISMENSDSDKRLGKMEVCDKALSSSPSKKESDTSTNSTAIQETSAEVEISSNVDISKNLTNEQKIYNKLPEYCLSNIICQKSQQQQQQQQQQQVNTEIELLDKIKEEPEDINDSPLLGIQNQNENIVKEIFENNTSVQIKQEPLILEPNKKEIDIDHIKQERFVELETEKKDIVSLYSRLPDYVTDIGNVKPKIDLPGVVFEKVIPQEVTPDEQNEGCKKKKKLNLVEYRMRKMNSAESSRCCSPNISSNTAEGKMNSFNNQDIHSEWSALLKTSEDREEGEIKEESGYLSNISKEKISPTKTKNNAVECRSSSKKPNMLRYTNGERGSRYLRQKRRQQPNETGKNKPTVIEIDLEAEEEEKKREEKIKAKLGFISNLKMPATSLGHSLLYSTKNPSETNHNSKYPLSSSSRKSSKKRHYDSSSSSRSRSRSYSSKESSHRKRSKGRSKRTSNHRKSRRRLSRSRTRSESLTSLSSLSSSGVSSRSRSRSTTKSKSKSKSYSKYKSHRSRSRSRSRSRRRRHKHKRSSRSYGWSRYRSRSRSPLSSWGTSRYTPVSTYGYSAYQPEYYGTGYNSYDYMEPQKNYDQGGCENERTVIHVSGILDGTSKSEFRSMFEKFGEIVNVTVHLRETGDNFGFVNFRTKEGAYAAIEYGESNPHLPFKISFGNRRLFCKENYSDLDAQNEQGKYYSANDMDYDTLFQTHRLQRQ